MDIQFQPDVHVQHLCLRLRWIYRTRARQARTTQGMLRLADIPFRRTSCGDVTRVQKRLKPAWRSQIWARQSPSCTATPVITRYASDVTHRPGTNSNSPPAPGADRNCGDGKECSQLSRILVNSIDDLETEDNSTKKRIRRRLTSFCPRQSRFYKANLPMKLWRHHSIFQICGDRASSRGRHH